MRERTVKELVAQNILLRRENAELQRYNLELTERIQQLDQERIRRFIDESFRQQATL